MWKNAGLRTRAHQGTRMARGEWARTSLAEPSAVGWRPFVNCQIWKSGSLGEIPSGSSVTRRCVVAFNHPPTTWARIPYIGVAGAALVLVLQEAVDPTPLFWTAPGEAIQLLLSRKRRVNHLWLHRTQELACESIGGSSKVDGFAVAGGFVLIGVGGNKQLVPWTAECAWRGVVHECERARHPRGGCKAVRFLLSLWLLTGGLFALSIWRGIDLPAALLIAVFSGAAGHALARPFENKLGPWLGGPARDDADAGGYCLEVETVGFPEWLWWQGSEGFIVRRIRDEEPHKD